MKNIMELRQYFTSSALNTLNSVPLPVFTLYSKILIVCVCVCVIHNSPNTKKISIKEKEFWFTLNLQTHICQFNNSIQAFKCQISAAAKSTVQFNCVLQDIFPFGWKGCTFNSKLIYPSVKGQEIEILPLPWKYALSLMNYTLNSIFFWPCIFI